MTAAEELVRDMDIETRYVLLQWYKHRTSLWAERILRKLKAWDSSASNRLNSKGERLFEILDSKYKTCDICEKVISKRAWTRHQNSLTHARHVIKEQIDAENHRVQQERGDSDAVMCGRAHPDYYWTEHLLSETNRKMNNLIEFTAQTAHPYLTNRQKLVAHYGRPKGTSRQSRDRIPLTWAAYTNDDFLTYMEEHHRWGGKNTIMKAVCDKFWELYESQKDASLPFETVARGEEFQDYLNTTVQLDLLKNC